MTTKDFDWIDVADLVPWVKNPRWNDKAVEPVAASIQQFGFGAPIVVQAGTNMIIAGHTRLKAAMNLGWKKVPCRILEITDRNAERLAIADNKTNEIADWNEEHLQEIMAKFEPEELEGLGFTDDELKDLLGDQESEGSEEEESFEELPKVNTDQTFTLLKGDCLQRLKELEDASIDSVVCDPPYEIDFMGKGWDRSGIAYSVELWGQCLRVLKPGGHLIAFCATRTVHGMATAIESAGFEIRDQLVWCYESGFPKSLDVSKAIDDKLGKKRKVVGYRQSEGGRSGETSTVGDHLIKFGTEIPITKPASEAAKRFEGWGTALKPAFEPAVVARKPLEGTVAENFLEYGVGGMNIEGTRFPYGDPIWFGSSDEKNNGQTGRWPANIVRFKKAQRSEREEGLDHLSDHVSAAVETHGKDSKGLNSPRAGAGRTADGVKNFHPTVKPLDLMRWSIKLITPTNGVVLDPFLGSGTTAAAAMLEGVSCIGCEITPDYWPIIEGRVENAKRQYLEGDQDGKKDKDQ